MVLVGRRYAFFGIVVAFAMLAGCVTVGHRAIRSSRTDYNVALRQTEDEQLLLNLVRLRYRDRPLFLETTALTTQFSFAPSAEASASTGGGEPTVFGLGGTIAFEETPTITYIPLQGTDYVQRILSKIPVETMVLLDGSGWSSERIYRVCLQGMNGLENAPRAAGPTPLEAPEFESFFRATKLLRELELRDGVDGSKRRVGGRDVVVLRFTPAAREAPEFHELARLLEIDPAAETFELGTRVAPAGGDTIQVRPRSFSGVLYFLSQSVEVPAEDIEAGRVTVTRDDGGNVFDWSRVTADLMRVRSSESRPERAAVAVPYRGHWFYIDDADLDSKSTFSMLAQLYSLQAGGTEGLTPVLTLPVGD